MTRNQFFATLCGAVAAPFVVKRKSHTLACGRPHMWISGPSERGMCTVLDEPVQEWPLFFPNLPAGRT